MTLEAILNNISPEPPLSDADLQSLYRAFGLRDLLIEVGALQSVVVPLFIQVRDFAEAYPEIDRPRLVKGVRGRLFSEDGRYQRLRFLVTKALPAVLDASLPEDLSARLGTEGSAGQGVATSVPWTRLYSTNPADQALSAQSGYYLVYLFSEDGKSVALSLNQGTTDLTRDTIRNRVEQARGWGGAGLAGLDLDIDLLAVPPLVDSARAKAYEVGNIGAITYDLTDLSKQDDQLVAELQSMVRLQVEIYEQSRGSVHESRTSDTAPPASPDELALVALSEQTGWPLRELRDVIAALRSAKPQVLLAGPPGTGKTWVAKAIASHLTDSDTTKIKIVQFHPTYGYEEFVEGLRPVVIDGAVHFEVQPGHLLQFIGSLGSDGRAVLILDEINRANLPRVLGELMYALEYRGEAIDLLHSRGFQLPEKLSIIGTMNTADRSIRSIDIALRRRFEIYECPPRPGLLEGFFEDEGRTLDVPDLAEGLSRLNAALVEQLDRHHAIGHSFFMADQFGPEDLRRVWDRQLYPLIEEYFFDQPDVAAQFRLSEFWGVEDGD